MSADRSSSAMPLNILYLHEISQISGAEKSLLKLVENIDKAKFKPVFILPEEGPFSSHLKNLGIEVILVNFPKIRKFIGVRKTLKQISNIIRKRKIALVHANSIRTNMYAAVAAKFSHIPVVWHQRNLLENEIMDLDRLFSFLPNVIICNSYAVSRRFMKSNYLAIIKSTFLRLVMVVTGRWSKADVLKKTGHLPAKVRVVYNGVDTQEFNPAISGAAVRQSLKIKSEEIVVGIVSRFNKCKGHEVFFQAAKIIITEMPEIAATMHFLVVGGAVFAQDGNREIYLRSLVKKLMLDDKVIFMGFSQDMPQVYAAMDLVVLTSRAEACGRVILEAMASAKPLIATDSGGTPEMVIDNLTGYLFEPGDSRVLADKIISLAKNRNLAKEFGLAARKRVEENFKIDKNVKAIEQIYMENIHMEQSHGA